MDIAIKQMNDVSATLQRNNRFLESKIEEVQQLQCQLQSQLMTDTKYLVYSYDFDQEAIRVIGKYFTEFAETAYDHGYVIYLKGECNREVNAYLESMDDNNNLTSCVNALDNLMKFKMVEEDSSQDLSPAKIYRQMKLLGNNVNNVLETLNTVPKTNEFEAIIQKERLRKGICNSRCHASKYLNQAIKSPIFMEKLCQYLSVDHTDTDTYDLPPPFVNMTNLTEKKKHLMDFLEYLKANVNGDIEKTSMQATLTKFINDIDFVEDIDFVDLRDNDQMEKTKADYKTKYGLEDTIGTLHVYFNRDEEEYYYFIVINDWLYKKDFEESKEKILESIYKLLDDIDWPKKGKLATDLDVPDHLSNFFVSTTNKDVFTEDSEVFRMLIELNDASFKYRNTSQDSLSLYKIDQLFLGFLHGKI